MRMRRSDFFVPVLQSIVGQTNKGIGGDEIIGLSRFEKCCVVPAHAPPPCPRKKCSFHARRNWYALIVFTRISAHQCAHTLAECQSIGRTEVETTLWLFPDIGS